MARTKPYPIRLSDNDRKLLAEIAEHNQRDQPDMIRVLIRNEHARVFGVKTAPRPAPLPAGDTDDADDADDFDIVDD